MSVSSGFDAVQLVANASPASVALGRQYRDLFRDTLKTEPDVMAVVASGSFARRTHKDPIHDIDLLVIFDPDRHPDWLEPGPSAEAALEHTRGLVRPIAEVRWTRLNSHSVKSFLDDADPDCEFTVDTTPAVRHPAGGLWIPERDKEHWVRTDPEDLKAKVAKRQSDWNEFTKLVRVLKRWNSDHGATMKSLVVEVLALDNLPVADRPQALQSFFAAAQIAVLSPVCDPSNLCGEIDPNMDRQKASEVLANAADLAWRAVAAEARGDSDTAMCLWRDIFGDIYPAPPGGCSGSGAAAGAAAVATVRRPKRPIRDAPQG